MDPDYAYSPSRWSTRGTADEIFEHHMKVVTIASEEAKASISCSLEVPYGSGDGEKMDIYGLDLPKDAPVCVYIHGGYWQDLSRPISAYPVAPLYRAGCLTVVLGYDLAPKVTVAEIVEEIRRGMVKVLEFAAERGSKSVVVAGHSAGAHLASMLLSKNWIGSQGKRAELLKGLLLISGIFDLRPLIETYVNKLLSLDLESASAVSPLLHLEENEEKLNVRLVVIVGEHDPPSFKDQSALFHKLLLEKGYQAEFRMLQGLDHFNIVEKLTEDGYELTKLFSELTM